MTLQSHLHCPCCPHYRKPESLSLGPLILDVGQHAVWWHGKRLANLTVIEFRILTLLASRPGQPLSQREIYDVIKPPGFRAGNGENGYRSNVRSAVRHIRRKFADVDPQFDALQTYHGVGYNWAVPVPAVLASADEKSSLEP